MAGPILALPGRLKLQQQQRVQRIRTNRNFDGQQRFRIKK